jgi:hypothetical protein
MMRRCLGALATLLALATIVACRQGGAARATDVVAATKPAARRDYRATFASPLAGATLTGSASCFDCHDEEGADWKTSRHASTFRPATVENEDQLSTLGACSDMSVTHVLGGHHQLRFLVEKPDAPWGQGRFLALPCAFSVDSGSMEMHHADDWRMLPFETSCAHCHVTRQSQDFSFTETSVGCEACHGPGSAHVADPTKANTFTFAGRSAAEEVTVCGSCHLQGGKSTRTGFNFPDGWVPGASLFDDYQFDWASLDHPTEAEAIDVHQKLLIREVVVDGTSDMRCTSCHQLHGMSHQKHESLPRQTYCLTCHQPETYKLKEYRQSCPVCEF